MRIVLVQKSNLAFDSCRFWNDRRFSGLSSQSIKSVSIVNAPPSSSINPLRLVGFSHIWYSLASSSTRETIVQSVPRPVRLEISVRFAARQSWGCNQFKDFGLTFSSLPLVPRVPRMPSSFRVATKFRSWSVCFFDRILVFWRLSGQVVRHLLYLTTRPRSTREFNEYCVPLLDYYC